MSNRSTGGLKRTRAIVFVVALASSIALSACGGDEPEPSSTAAPGSWEETVAAAKREGKLVLGTGSGPGFEKFAQRAKDAMSEYFEVQYTLMRGGDWVTRVLAEQAAGQYLWDVHVGPGNNKYTALAPANGLDSTREFMESLPQDNRRDADWRGGFAFFDDAEGGSFVHMVGVTRTIAINRDVEGADQITSPEDLLDPRWKGKFAMYEPTAVNSAVQGLTWFLQREEYGEDFIRKLFGQDIVFGTRDQVTQWVAEGRYAAAFGVDDTILAELAEQGIGKNTEIVDWGAYLGAETTSVIKNPPHPNATRVFLNWFLSKEGQNAWVELSTEDSSSRRLDAPNLHPEAAPEFKTLEELGPIGGASKEAEVPIQEVMKIAEASR